MTPSQEMTAAYRVIVEQEREATQLRARIVGLQEQLSAAQDAPDRRQSSGGILLPALLILLWLALAWLLGQSGPF